MSIVPSFSFQHVNGFPGGGEGGHCVARVDGDVCSTEATARGRLGRAGHAGG